MKKQQTIDNIFASGRHRPGSVDAETFDSHHALPKMKVVRKRKPQRQGQNGAHNKSIDFMRNEETLAAFKLMAIEPYGHHRNASTSINYINSSPKFHVNNQYFF